MPPKYKEIQRTKSIALIENNDPVFYGSPAGRIFMGSAREFVLLENQSNLSTKSFERIR